METREWKGARATLDDGLVVVWPHSVETFSSADRFIEMQRPTRRDGRSRSHGLSRTPRS
jgi:hypothetical protein